MKEVGDGVVGGIWREMVTTLGGGKIRRDKFFDFGGFWAGEARGGGFCVVFGFFGFLQTAWRVVEILRCPSDFVEHCACL